MDITPEIITKLERQIINEIRIAEEYRNFAHIVSLQERLHTIKTLRKYWLGRNDELGDLVFDIIKPL